MEVRWARSEAAWRSDRRSHVRLRLEVNINVNLCGVYLPIVVARSGLRLAAGRNTFLSSPAQPDTGQDYLTVPRKAPPLSKMSLVLW